MNLAPFHTMSYRLVLVNIYGMSIGMKYIRHQRINSYLKKKMVSIVP